LHRAHWGIEVYDPAARRTLYALNSERHFIPASNMKLVVTAVALGLLGADYRYRTEIYATAPGVDISGGEVHAGASRGETTSGIAGSLVIVARGDPTLSRRFHPEGPAPIELLA